MTAVTLPRLRRIRWAVRATLAFGVAASVAANILHAQTNPISQAIAAWPPLALLLTVELVSRVPVHRRSLAAVRMVATATISGIAAWVSYWHMAGVAARYGEAGASPYLLPVSVDGLIVVASICLVELAGRIRHAETRPVPAPPAAAVPAPPARSIQDGPGAVPVTVPALPATVLGEEEGQAVDADLIDRARAAAAACRRDTGRDITRDQLRAVLRVSNATAGELLRHLPQPRPAPALATPGRGNGSIPMIGELTR